MQRILITGGKAHSGAGKRGKGMFEVNYCDYNRVNPDYDRIDRPQGSGDHLLLFLVTPMKFWIDGEMIVSRENAFIYYPKGAPQIYEAVRSFRNSFIHFDMNEGADLNRFHIPENIRAACEIS